MATNKTTRATKRGMVAALALALLAGVGCAASDEQGTPTPPDATVPPDSSDETTTSTAPAAAEPAPTLASPYLQGTLDMQLPAGEPDELSIIAVGTPQSSTPVVVRNNTAETLEIHLTATARDANGALVGSGEDQGLEAVRVEPGQVAIGYVYLGIDDPPQGTTLEVSAQGEEVDDDFGKLPGVIAEHNLAPGQYTEQVVGMVRNDNTVAMEGPISVLVMCFDDVGIPVSTAGGYTEVEVLEPGQQGSFSVDLYGENGCPYYLVGASGYTF